MAKLRSTNDTIADMLTRLRNASMRQKKEVLVPRTKLTLSIAKILHDEGYIVLHSYNDAKFLHIDLEYRSTQDSKVVSHITGLKRISKPGLRIYAEANQIPKVLGGIGIAIISTSKGIMTDRMARENKIGGEIMCFIW